MEFFNNQVGPYPCDYSDLEQCYIDTGSPVVIDPATGQAVTPPVSTSGDTEPTTPAPTPAPVAQPSNITPWVIGLAAIFFLWGRR